MDSNLTDAERARIRAKLIAEARANADLIAAAPALVAEVRRLRGENERLRAKAALAEEAAVAARSYTRGERDSETGARYPVDWHDWLARYDALGGTDG